MTKVKPFTSEHYENSMAFVCHRQHSSGLKEHCATILYGDHTIKKTVARKAAKAFCKTMNKIHPSI